MAAARNAPRRRGLPRPLRWAGAALLLAVFGSAGGFLALDLGRTLAGTAAARHWQPVPARLLDWELLSSTHQTVRGFAIRRSSHELRARYAYRHGDCEHRGERVSFTPLRDNFSDRWRTAVTRRLQAAAAGAPLTVWIDPADPSQSVLEPALPLEHSVFAAAFLLFPCGIASALLLGSALRWSAGGDAIAADRRNRRWLLPLWATLHGAPALAIALLAEPGSIGWGSGALLAGLLAVLAAGLYGLLRAARRRHPSSLPHEPVR